MALLRGVRDSMWRIAVLSLPGTIAHQLTHFIVGALLLAKPRGFSVWPKVVGCSWKLGSVSFGSIGLLNGRRRHPRLPGERSFDRCCFAGDRGRSEVERGHRIASRLPRPHTYRARQTLRRQRFIFLRGVYA